MKTAEALVSLYKTFDDLEGPQVAREFVANSVSFIIGNIEDEKLPVTSDEIERRIALEASEYETMAKSNKKTSA